MTTFAVENGDATLEVATEDVLATSPETQVDDEDVTETVSWEIPTSVDNTTIDLTANVNKANLMISVISALIILMAMIAMIFNVKKKVKINVMAFVMGVATYIIFFYYGQNITGLLNLIPAVKEYSLNPEAHKDFFIVISLISYVILAAIATGGRLLCMLLYRKDSNKFSTHLSVGVGVVSGYAVYTAVSSFLVFISGNTVASTGWAEFLKHLSTNSNIVTQASFDSYVLAYYKEFILINPSYYVFNAIDSLLLMVLLYGVTYPIATAFQNKESKWWYGFAMAAYAIFEILLYLRLQELWPDILTVVLQLVVVGVVFYFGRRKYLDYYEEAAKQEKEEEEKKNNTPSTKKKMPRFENLSNL